MLRFIARLRHGEDRGSGAPADCVGGEPGLRPRAGDLSGAIADLGIFVPLVAALVLLNGLDVAAVLLAAGALVLAAGAAFRVPFPVQPLKALTALAVAKELSPEVIHAAGLQIGLLLVVLSVTGLADGLARLFTKPVIRSLQFGVGILLVFTAVRLVLEPPALFEHAPPPAWGAAAAAGTLVAVAVAAHRRWYAVGVVVLAAGMAVSWVVASPDLGTVAVGLPGLSVPPLAVFGTAFVLLVVPQVPLTYGNAVVGVSDLARESFGAGARRVTPGRVALSCGLGNVGSAVVGGMPMCHGSSGLSAHVRLGARGPAMNLLLGSVFVVLGVVFPAQVLTLFALLPVWALAGFLAYAGARHALLVADQRGLRLAIALVAGLVGVVTGNLAITTALALAAVHLPRLWSRKRP